MNSIATMWSTVFNQLKENEAASVMAPSYTAVSQPPANVKRWANVVTFTVQSSQREVVVAVNPGSLEEDYQTQVLNRAMELGYEPAMMPTTGPLFRRAHALDL